MTVFRKLRLNAVFLGISALLMGMISDEELYRQYLSKKHNVIH